MGKVCRDELSEILDNISTCKSPHEMEGAVLKTYYAKKMGINPKIFLSAQLCHVQ
jgi:NADP-reducing hydrogenase subunit HndD